MYYLTLTLTLQTTEPGPYVGLTNLRTTEPSEQKAVNFVVGLQNLRN